MECGALWGECGLGYRAGRHHSCTLQWFSVCLPSPAVTYGFIDDEITIREGESVNVTVGFLSPTVVELSVRLDITIASEGTALRES